MNCEQCQEQLDDLIFGPEGHPEAPDTTSVQGHLDQCAPCRKHFESLTRLGRCFSGMEELAARLPAERVARVHERILEAVKAQKAEASDRKRLPAILRFPAWGWTTVAAAAVAAVALGAWLLMPPTKPTSRAVAAKKPTASAVSHAVPAPAKAEVKAAAKPKAPEVTLEALQAEFARLKASTQGVGDEFLRKLVRYAVDNARTPQEAMQAQKLIVETYEQMGERDLARAAFAKYLEDVEQVEGPDRAVSYAQAKAGEIFYRQKDYLGGLGYYDLVMTRYPNTPQGEDAQFMTGMYYERLERWPEALVQYRKVAEQIPQTESGKRARKRVWLMFANLHQEQAAIEEITKFMKEYPEGEDAACAQFELACMYYWKGLAHYPEAVKQFKLFLEKYPDHRYASDVRRMLATIDEKLMGSML